MMLTMLTMMIRRLIEAFRLVHVDGEGLWLVATFVRGVCTPAPLHDAMAPLVALTLAPWLDSMTPMWVPIGTISWAPAPLIMPTIHASCGAPTPPSWP